MNLNRRDTLRQLGTGVLLTTVAPLSRGGDGADRSGVHIATNTYPWSTFARRDGESLKLHTDHLLADIASTGITGYEPIINSPDEFDGLAQRLGAHGLEMRSLYVNSVLHEEEQADSSIAQVVVIARRAKEVGTRIIVTNPSPIRWGGDEDKSDSQLITQAAALDRLGGELYDLDLSLAYHNHDAELRQGGREFHHMLTATDPQLVRLCLDSHWVYRGCGNSQVALFDALEHYGSRIVELHLRQSQGGVWTEVFSAKGDIDYRRLIRWLDQHDIEPHLCLEQAVEADSPRKHDVVAAHRSSYRNTKALFPAWRQRYFVVAAYERQDLGKHALVRR